MSRYQDAVIDDDEECCPLCIEDFDLFDKHFKPCPCGYQICQFCFNSLKTVNEVPTCPNCRRKYDESTVEYRLPTPEEVKLDQLNKSKRAAAAKRKEIEKREVETSNRRNLAGVRVKQQNLVYVIGLEPSKKDEVSLIELLRGKEYFGQYGPIEKIVVSKPKPGSVNQGIGVYVTFKNNEDAASCIKAVDGAPNNDKTLRAQYGTTKYCSAYLRGEQCQNKNCSFLHENGEEMQTAAAQEESLQEKLRPPVPRTQSAVPTSQAQLTLGSSSTKDNASSRSGSIDVSALPATAGWANAPVIRARRGSHAASTPSPQLPHATVAVSKQEHTRPAASALQSTAVEASVPCQSTSSVESTPPPALSSLEVQASLKDPVDQLFQDLKKSLVNDAGGFKFDVSSLTEAERVELDSLPPLFDLYGGAKRLIQRRKGEEARTRVEAAEKARLEEQAKLAAEDAMDEDLGASGSLALGGEPEDDLRGAATRGTIGHPMRSTSISTKPSNQLTSTHIDTTAVAAQQRTPGSTNVQPSQVHQGQSHNTAIAMSDFDRRTPQFSAAQYDQISSHARHGSRYFHGDNKTTNIMFKNQQPYFSSGVQGPPPGLPAAGTPPVSGGGMFAHGQGFTSGGFGATKDATMDSTRNRSGTNTGHDAKRGGVEYLADPSIITARAQQNSISGQGFLAGSQDDPEFPALPKRTGSALHSRVSSLQSTSVHRVATPRIPPGLEALAATRGSPGPETSHAHPTPIEPVFSNETSSPKPRPSTTTPALPMMPVLPSGSRRSSLKMVSKPEIHKDIDGNLSEPSQVGDKDSLTNETKPPSNASDASVSEPTAATTPHVRNLLHGNAELDTHSTKLTDPEKPTAVTPVLSAGFANQETERTMPRRQASLPMVAHARLADNKIHREGIESVQQKDAGTHDTSMQEQATINGSKKAVVNKPTKIETPPAVVHLREDSTAEQVVKKGTLDSDIVQTPDVLSRPNTPSKLKEEVKRPAAMRNVTLTITSEEIQQSRRSESAAPASATTEKSAPLPTLSQIRQSSRQPSVSTSRPSTPSVSDRFPSMSRDVSRAGSPPPSIVGSAPARQKTKAQLKKERRERTRQTNEASETGSVITSSTPADEEAIAPVLSRQTKKKKDFQLATVPPSPAKRVVSNKAQSQPVDDFIETKPTVSSPKKKTAATGRDAGKSASKVSTPKQETPPPVREAPRQPYTLLDLYNTATQLQKDHPYADVMTDLSQPDIDPVVREQTTAYKTDLQNHIVASSSAVNKLISELVSSGDIATSHPLFKPAPFSSPVYKLPMDYRKGQEYLDAHNYTPTSAFGYVYLPQKEKRALQNGHAVSIADSSENGKSDLIGRCLITPNGCVLRHLSAEESEQVLDLEERRQQFMDEFGELGAMDKMTQRLEDDDHINLEGGFEELIRYGERHGVCWVVGDNETIYDRRTARYGAGNGLEDDYGLGDMPIDEDELLDDEVDEDELEGEEMILESAERNPLYNHARYTDTNELDDEYTLTGPAGHQHGSNMSRASDRHTPVATRPPDSVNATAYPTSSGRYNRPDDMFDDLDVELPPPPPHQLAPLHSHFLPSRAATFRHFDLETLQKKATSLGKEVEQARKDAEKKEKQYNKTAKDLARYANSISKAAV